MTASARQPVAIVTGGASGIGAACAQLLAERDHRVSILDIMNPVGERSDPRIDHVVVDVRDETALERAVDAIAQTHGGIDVAVLAAGLMTPLGSVITTSAEDWGRIFDVNVTGTFLSARAVARYMVSRRAGAICIIGSETVLRAARDYSAYVASKHAVVGLGKSMAVDLGAFGVRVNVVLPGATGTAGLANTFASGADFEKSLVQFANASPLGRIVAADEVARVVAFVCSNEASGMTGSVLVVDAGVTVGYPASRSAADEKERP